MQGLDALLDKFGRTFAPGEVVYDQGDPAQEIFVVNEGLVQETRRSMGVDKLLREVGPGEFFGEVALVSGSPRLTRAVAVAMSRIIVVPRETFEQLVRNNIEVSIRLARKLARYLEQYHEDVTHLMFRDSRARVVSLLAARRTPVQVTSIAKTLGLPTNEVDAVLERLAGARMIRLDGGSVTVTAGDRLAEYLKYLQLQEEFGAI